MKIVLNVLRRLASLAVIAGLAYGGWVGYGRLTAEKEESGLGEVPMGKAEVRDITVTVSATGVLRPVRIVQVKSKAAGEVINMPVELGDHVVAGQLIAQIDTETLEQEFLQAQADLESAETRLKISDRQYERAKNLEKQDLVSVQDLEQSEQNYSTAKAQLLRAQAEIKLRQERLDDATVRAPVDGTIIKKDVEVGTIITSSVNNISGGATLVEMADLTELEIRTLVDEIDIGRVKAGLPVESTVEAFPSRRFTGQVVKIEPQAVVEQQVTTFPVLSYIDNSEGLLLPGMNADADVVIHRRPQVLTVPNEAIKTMADAAIVARLLGIEFDREALTAPTPANVAANQHPGGAPGGSDSLASDGSDEEELTAEKVRAMSPEDRRAAMAKLSDEERRELFAGARPGGSTGGRGGAPTGARPGGFGGPPGGAGGGRGGGGVSMDAFGVGQAPEPAVVFILDAEGTMVPRRVMIGVRDWEYTEVVDGLDEGAEVVMLPSTSLLNSNQALRDRFARFNRIPGVGSG